MRREMSRFSNVLLTHVLSILCANYKVSTETREIVFLWHCNFPSNICQKCGTCERKTRISWLIKLKFCTKANQTLLFKRLQNNFFLSRTLHRANISQIFSFTRTTEPHEIQLVLNIWSTSFDQPVKISIDSFAAVASFQLVTNIYQKWEYFPNVSLWNNCFLGKWGQRDKFLNCSYLMGIDA